MPEQYLKLYFGASNLEQITGPAPFSIFQIQKRAVKKILIHPNYSWPASYSDVAIIGITFSSPIIDSHFMLLGLLREIFVSNHLRRWSNNHTV